MPHLQQNIRNIYLILVNLHQGNLPKEQHAMTKGYRKFLLEYGYQEDLVDEKATSLAVEEYLETVRQNHQIGFVRREAAIT